MARKIDDSAAAAAATFNMTPMIDVCFQLIVVFLCSMKFRTLDEKIEASLPKDRSTESTAWAPPVAETTVHVRLARRDGEDAARVVLEGERVGTTAEGNPVWRRLEAAVAEFRARDPALVGEIDADAGVDHGDVMRALDGLKGAGVGRVRFRGAPLPRPPAR